MIFGGPDGRDHLEHRHLAGRHSSSSSHALIGGLVGAGVCKAGWNAVVWSGVGKTVAAIVLSPATGFFLALLLVLRRVLDLRAGQSPCKADKIFRMVQFVSASAYSPGPWRQ